MQVLDQQALPQKEQWLDVRSPEDMITYIKSLQVRGAPMIGVSAALSLANFARSGASYSEYLAAAEALRSARPTAVNLMYAIDKMKEIPQDRYSPDTALDVAIKIFEEDFKLCERIAQAGEPLIESGDQVLTICNTGGLATVGVGTALGVLRRAHESGKKIHVYVAETRPLLQGGRLTAWELQRLNIPSTLLCDSMAGTLMAQGKITKVIVGADRVAVNGDFANKIGTYTLAVLAKHHGIPFYMAAPTTTLDITCSSGQSIEIEQRAKAEVLGVKGSFGEVAWAPETCSVYNPAFDVTPADLISAWIFDRGVLYPKDIASGVFANWSIKE